MQKVTILNSGSTGAAIDGEPGFGPWVFVPDVHQLPSFIETNAKGLIGEAHEIVRETLAVPVMEAANVSYRQRLGSISGDSERGAVLVEVCYEIKNTVTDTASDGKAVFRCR